MRAKKPERCSAMEEHGLVLRRNSIMRLKDVPEALHIGLEPLRWCVQSHATTLTFWHEPPGICGKHLRKCSAWSKLVTGTHTNECCGHHAVDSGGYGLHLTLQLQPNGVTRVFPVEVAAVLNNT